MLCSSEGFSEAELNSAKRNLVSLENIVASDPVVVAKRIMMDLVYADTRTPQQPLDKNLWYAISPPPKSQRKIKCKVFLGIKYFFCCIATGHKQHSAYWMRSWRI